MSRHLNRLNDEEAVEFDKAFEQFCEAENEENKMNMEFYLTIMRQPYKLGSDDTRQYYMAIFNVNAPRDPIFTSYLHPDKGSMMCVGKAYAKRLSIIYRECDT